MIKKGNNMSSVGEELPKEQARVRRLIEIYKTIGPVGNFAIMMMNQSLADAERAAISGDVVAILQAYNDLKGFKE